MLAEPFIMLHAFDLELLDLGEIAKIFAENTQNSDLLLLSGKVGAGKTEFARLLIKATAKNENIDRKPKRKIIFVFCSLMRMF